MTAFNYLHNITWGAFSSQNVSLPLTLCDRVAFATRNLSCFLGID